MTQDFVCPVSLGSKLQPGSIGSAPCRDPQRSNHGFAPQAVPNMLGRAFQPLDCSSKCVIFKACDASIATEAVPNPQVIPCFRRACAADLPRGCIETVCSEPLGESADMF
ncbi:unnamed protein product [Symbiodinium natans]|uniref:Uncharacterized protein n=1 Tax=Symbiodinium natans TaxID=878477 RepID=A0A812MCU2_9DINO|nr:unnamed protein product [Symbiodinium natans]